MLIVGATPLTLVFVGTIEVDASALVFLIRDVEEEVVEKAFIELGSRLWLLLADAIKVDEGD